MLISSLINLSGYLSIYLSTYLSRVLCTKTIVKHRSFGRFDSLYFGEIYSFVSLPPPPLPIMSAILPREIHVARSCRSINRIASGFRAVGRVAVRKVAGRSAPHYYSFRSGGSRPREEFYLRPSEIYCPARARDRIWEPSAPISGSGCVNFRGRASSSRELPPLVCLSTSPLTHACGLPRGVRPLGHGS